MLTVLEGKKVTLGKMKVKKGEKDDNLLQTFGPQNPLLLTLVPKSIKTLGVLSKRGLKACRGCQNTKHIKLDVYLC